MGFEKKAVLGLLFSLFFILSACAGFNTSSRPETIQHAQETDAKIKALQGQNKALARQIETIQASLQSLNKKVDTLGRQLEMAKKTPLPHKKDVIRIEKKSSKTRQTRRKAASSKGKVLPKRVLKSKSAGVPPLKLYHEAYRKYAAHKFHEAASAFLEFVKLYPQHPYANNALYWTGESYYSLGSYEKATFYFKEVVKKYPQGNKVPDALLKLGYTYAALDKKKIARDYLFKLMDQYPFSEAAQKAQAKLDELY